MDQILKARVVGGVAMLGSHLLHWVGIFIGRLDLVRLQASQLGWVVYGQLITGT